MASWAFVREIPNYQAIYAKSSEYKKMTKGEVDDHLSKNHFHAEVTQSTLFNTQLVAVILSCSIVFMGGIVGGCLAMRGVYDIAIYIGAISGGLTIVLLAIAGCARCVSYYRQQQQLSDEEFQELMKEINRVKAEDIKFLESTHKIHNLWAQDNQQQISEYKNLHF